MRERRNSGEGGSKTPMYAAGIVIGSVVVLVMLRGGLRGHLG